MKIGVIGGSGVYDMEGLESVRTERVDTPFGSPSDEYICGCIAGHEVHFRPRHGKGHRLLPTEINHRANIFGFKLLGVEHVISISAVGSLKEELRPRDVVLPDQYFDRTKADGEHTFFGEGIVGHVAFAEPACPALRRQIVDTFKSVLATDFPDRDTRVVDGGTYVNMAGPAFSTRAESFFHRKMGFDVIGMTSLAEAKLCREAEICYQPIAMVTDYDCWRESEEAVTVDAVIAHLQANTELAKHALRKLLENLEDLGTCSCREALASALITQPGTAPAETLKKLAPIVGKYLAPQ